MKMQKLEKRPIVNGNYTMEKFPGKGGWTFVSVPEIPQDKKTYFGWVKVRGQIDDYELEHVKLMPMGNGTLFLPVKASIRKEIGKEAGDIVRVVLYLDDTKYQVREEIIECFENEPPALAETFFSFTDGEQKAYVDWIYDAKTDETKTNRIAEMMDRLQKKLRFFD